MEDQQVSYDNLLEEIKEKERDCEETTLQLKDKILVLGQEKSNELAVLKGRSKWILEWFNELFNLYLYN